ncbi:hypothetical protein AB1Y20_012170 [Prymnesium parvum]|uniref:Uncharacterized protein n=1 Tax=Prymnesium parvum TaxID=97485 RepID=A0AB34INB7_PRYPA
MVEAASCALLSHTAHDHAEDLTSLRMMSQGETTAQTKLKRLDAEEELLRRVKRCLEGELRTLQARALPGVHALSSSVARGSGAPQEEQMKLEQLLREEKEKEEAEVQADVQRVLRSLEQTPAAEATDAGLQRSPPHDHERIPSPMYYPEAQLHDASQRDDDELSREWGPAEASEFDLFGVPV